MTTTELQGLIEDLDEEVYHAHPALSNSGAKLLLPPSCPARFQWERVNGRPEKRVYDVGHAAHKGILGVGGEVVIVQSTAKDGTHTDAVNYQTKSAQEHRDVIRAAGKVPLLASEAAAVEQMVAAVRAHPEAGPLLAHADGRPEVSLFWEDWTHGITRRSRLDWLILHGDSKATVVDVKTCVSADRETFAKAVYSNGYDMQEVFYTDGLLELGAATEVDFLFVAVEKDPPHLVEVFRLDPSFRRIGRRRVDTALRVFAECERNGVWPGYSTTVQTLSPPVWAAREWDEDVL